MATLERRKAPNDCDDPARFPGRILKAPPGFLPLAMIKCRRRQGLEEPGLAGLKIKLFFIRKSSQMANHPRIKKEAQTKHKWPRKIFGLRSQKDAKGCLLERLR